MSNTTDNNELDVEIIERWITGGATEYSVDGGVHWWTKDQFEYIQKYVTQAANKAAEAARIEPFNFVESCEPECSPERHAYHQGQWDMAVRMEAALTTEQKGETA